MLISAALALQALYPLLFLLEGDAPVLLMAALTYAILPIAAALLSCWAALGGVHPLAACLPVGGLALMLGTSPPWAGLLCLLLSIIGSAAGQEWEKRRNGEEKKKHAGKAEKGKRRS